MVGTKQPASDVRQVLRFLTFIIWNILVLCCYLDSGPQTYRTPNEIQMTFLSVSATLSLHSLCGWVSGPGWPHLKLYQRFFKEKIKIRIQNTKLCLFQPITGQLTAVILISNWLTNNFGTILFFLFKFNLFFVVGGKVV